MITKADYLGIVVDDLEASKKFYQEKLQLQIDERYDVPGEFAAFKLDGGAMLAIQTIIPSSGEAVKQPFIPGLAVDDADKTHAAFLAGGVEVLEKPRDLPYGRTFLFRTPDGHVLRAYQPPAGN